MTYLMNKLKNSYLSYFLMYNFYYFSNALFSALISVYLLDKGYLASDVSMVVALSYLSSMVAQPFIGVLQDKYDAKRVNAILLLLAAAGSFYFMFANQLIEMAIGYSFVMMMINGSNPVLERIATRSRFQYGKIRIWGTIGYSTGAQAAGLIYDYISPQALYIFFSIAILFCIAGLYGTVEIIPEIEIKTQDKKENQGAFKTLFKNKKFLYYLLIAGLFYGITNIGHIYISSMFQHDGIPISQVSTILLIACLCEFPFVFFSNKFMDKISNKTLLIIVFVMTILQTFSYGVNVWMPLKVLVTLLTKHPAGMLFIMINLKVVNTIVDSKHQVTALSLVYTVRNFASIIFQNIAGFILDTSTYSHMFMGCFGVIVFGFVLVLFFRIPSGNDQKLFE